jgi:hypothetical protein
LKWGFGKESNTYCVFTAQVRVKVKVTFVSSQVNVWVWIFFVALHPSLSTPALVVTCLRQPGVIHPPFYAMIGCKKNRRKKKSWWGIIRTRKCFPSSTTAHG